MQILRPPRYLDCGENLESFIWIWTLEEPAGDVVDVVPNESTETCSFSKAYIGVHLPPFKALNF